MGRFLIASLTGLLVGLMVGAPAVAVSAPITASFPGTITEIYDRYGRLDPVFEVGTSFTISYSIDPDAAVRGRDCNQRFCSYTGVPAGSFTASLTIRDRVFASDNVNVFVWNDVIDVFGPPGLPLDIWAVSFDPDETIERNVVWVLFADVATLRLTSTEFLVIEDLEGWTATTLSVGMPWIPIYFLPPRGPIAIGAIVPEPTTLALLLPALVAVFAWVRWRRPRSDGG
jgi:hypothetical protein